MAVSINHTDASISQEESSPRKDSTPFLWFLLLLAVIAATWFFYSRSASNTTVTRTPVSPSIITGDSEQTAAQAERDRADAVAARKADRASRQAASERKESTKPGIADRGPEPVARVQPKYPPTAYRNREEGSVLVRAEIDAGGVPADVSVERRSGSRDLDRAALDAVRQWHFRPAIENGKAVASTVEVPVDFKLGEQ